jgi:sugar-specific transcriptional regulator TrmB
MTTTSHLLNLCNLSEKEALLYMTLLELGRASVVTLAMKTTIKRPTVYVLLENLSEQGIVQLIPRNKKRLYTATPPSVLYEKVQQKITLAEKEVRELTSRSKRAPEQLSALYFEGLKNLNQAFTYKLSEFVGSECVGFYAQASENNKDAYKATESWLDTMKTNTISVRGIAPENKAVSDFLNKQDPVPTIHFLPQNIYSSDISIDTIGNIVRILDFKNLQGTIIENNDVAKTLREIFELVWTQTEKKY